MGPLPRPRRERTHHIGRHRGGFRAPATARKLPAAAGGLGPRSSAQTRPVRLRPVTVEAMTTRTAATAIAMSQRTQSMPGLPFPPKAV
jgi:hypothetical protein